MNQWKWCLTDSNNKVIKGWYQDTNSDKWYHLNNETGVLDTGWFQDKDSRWYYLDEQNGDLKTGWIQLKGVWFFLEIDSNGYQGECYVDRTATINGKEYSFDSNGHLIENNYILSSQGADFIGSWEGFWKQAKFDPYYPNDNRYITIGYGTTYSAIPSAFNEDNPLSTTCTVEQARQWLQEEAQTCAEAIKDKLDSNNITLSINAIDSLISFSYNCGTGALFNSTLWKNICNGVTDRDTISSNFCAYCKANGVTSQGLLKRRQSEVALYFDSDYTGNN
jgi:lysozyme